MHWRSLKVELENDDLEGVDILTKAQRRCLKAAQYILSTHGAVLLSEALGVGKSYVAAGLALLSQRAWGVELCVLAPAHLLPMWRKVMRIFELRACYYSYASASLGRLELGAGRLWLVDEAHYLKNSRTKRYQNFRRAAALDCMCLITATPITMQKRDLRNLMHLCGFSGRNTEFSLLQSFAEALRPSAYVPALVVKALPSVIREKRHYVLSSVGVAEDKLYKILERSDFPVVLEDGRVVKMALILELLLERWLSHEHALRMSLRRLRRYFRHCELEGKVLSRRKFYRIFGVEGMQLALQFSKHRVDDAAISHMQAACGEVEEALAILALNLTVEDTKLKCFREILNELEEGEYCLAFTKYADTAIEFARKLCGEDIALLCGNLAQFRGHGVCRATLLALFSPENELARKQWARFGFSLPKAIICTDVLSHGHNLQLATVLVHLDLPLNPATMRQREGRILRYGQRASSVRIITLGASCRVAGMRAFQAKRLGNLSRREALMKQSAAVTLPEFDEGRIYLPRGSGLGAAILVLENEWCFIHIKRLSELLRKPRSFELTQGAVRLPVRSSAVRQCLEALCRERSILRHLAEQSSKSNKIRAIEFYISVRTQICEIYDISYVINMKLPHFIACGYSTASKYGKYAENLSIGVFRASLPTSYPQVIHSSVHKFCESTNRNLA
ncbi:MAG: DEAD/DEAH box helicase [Bradymonadales bacterium]|jgi:superfamily II DNA or RNA helicase